MKTLQKPCRQPKLERTDLLGHGLHDILWCCKAQHITVTHWWDYSQIPIKNKGKRTKFILRSKSQGKCSSLIFSWHPPRTASTEGATFLFQQTSKTHTILHFTDFKKDKWSARFFFQGFACYNNVLKLVKFNIIHFPESKRFFRSTLSSKSVLNMYPNIWYLASSNQL